LDIVKIKTRLRSGSGKSYTRKARILGWIPGNYYGHNRTAKNVEVDAKELLILVRTRKTRNLIDLCLDEEKGDSIAIIKEIQRDVLDDKKFLHVDFQHVAMDEKVTVKVPVELVGIPVGVKEQAGVLGHPAKFLNVECMPVNIPEKISVDVTNLKIGDSIHVRDLTVQDAVIKDSPDEVVAVIILASAEEEKPKEDEAVAEGAEGAEGAAPGAAEAAGTAVGEAAKGDAAKGDAKKSDAKKDAGAAKGDVKKDAGAKSPKDSKGPKGSK
jgi:large subunit ribosomal protein L25